MAEWILNIGIVGEEGVYIKTQQDRYQGVVDCEKYRQFF